MTLETVRFSQDLTSKSLVQFPIHESSCYIMMHHDQFLKFSFIIGLFCNDNNILVYNDISWSMIIINKLLCTSFLWKN